MKFNKNNAKSYFVVAGLIAIVLYVCLSNKTINTDVKTTTKANDNSSDPHFTRARSWLKEARRIADTTQDEEAKRIADFLTGSAGIGIAGANSFSPIFLQPNGATKLLIVPILNGDASIGDGLSFISDSRTFMAIFIAKYKLIMLRPTPLSDTWKGIILLHEGRHALLATTESRSSEDPLQMAAEERDTHEFQNRITEKIGGEKYAQLLREEILRQRNDKGSAHFPPGSAFADVSSYQTGLDDAFGPARSSIERDFRQTSIWMHAVFTLIDADSSISDKESYKAVLLYSIYKTQGMIP